MKQQLFDRLHSFGQEHLLTFWDSLDERERTDLAAQLEQIDLPRLKNLYESRNAPAESLTLVDRASSPSAYKFSTVPTSTPACVAKKPISAQEAIVAGKEALSKGIIGAILVAGGQGTRLGFPHPKGMYPIGPVSDATLFQIHFEKVLATSRQFGRRIPYCIMTSPATHDETIAFLEKNNRFGLPKDDLFVFCQGTMPAIALEDGKILLEEKGSIARSPDGHGGMLAAIARKGSQGESSVLEQLQHRGIKHLFYHQVDNPLVPICSPEYLGYHLLSGSELTSQVIRKRFPTDKVGNIIDVDGRLYVIEYSDLPLSVAERKNPDGSLQIWAGSIAVHVFAVDLLERMSKAATSLPFHAAQKKVPFIDLETGEKRNPEKPNALKSERFIFDLLPSAQNAIVVEVDIPNHYGPLKNAPGNSSDSPELVKKQMSDLHSTWLRKAGCMVAPSTPIEISPLFADSPEDVAAKVEFGTIYDRPTYLSENEKK